MNLFTEPFISLFFSYYFKYYKINTILFYTLDLKKSKEYNLQIELCDITVKIIEKNNYIMRRCPVKTYGYRGSFQGVFFIKPSV